MSCLSLLLLLLLQLLITIINITTAAGGHRATLAAALWAHQPHLYSSSFSSLFEVRRCTVGRGSPQCENCVSAWF
jgi:hypothetical protein